MNMAMLAEGGGAVAEHQLLLSTAAVFDGCQTSKLKDLLDLSGPFLMAAGEMRIGSHS